MNWHDILFIFIAVLIWGINYNTKENHAHLHEIGCANNVPEFCEFVRGRK